MTRSSGTVHQCDRYVGHIGGRSSIPIEEKVLVPHACACTLVRTQKRIGVCATYGTTLLQAVSIPYSYGKMVLLRHPMVEPHLPHTR